MFKKTLGIIGGGQLGSMLAQSAKKLNIRTIIISDDRNAPAKNFSDEFIYGKYTNKKIINKFLKKVDVITFEFENIPFKVLNLMNKKVKVLPKPLINKIIQNRYLEKNFVNALKIQTTKFEYIKSKKDIYKSLNLLPGILKTCTLGYDGKGQIIINSAKQIEKIKFDLNKEYILEKKINIKKEISVIITRFALKKYEIYEPIENKHKDQILKYSKVPSNVNSNIKRKSTLYAKLISEKLNYIGTLCVEYFVDINDNLYVNEIAPRVHNSGHLTINSHNISQFENHIRAVCKLKKIKTKRIYKARMINLIGNDIKKYRNKKIKKNQFFFDYLKNDIKPKRKMGHVTILK
ncbi:MAG: 5-(carboxyamino)imidazole ribonucleotide synthase [Pelagibacteraceae bacterium TMED287]|nr:MAG: 5-(carboxyamino)imidazole ribonucleotide synthase [Pelagibacteraceae bacterium TMED287]|tara:strand:+ start:546 stop:1589 length:1044 start_codon:yes stop_codon:yes gene_type:complete